MNKPARTLISMAVIGLFAASTSQAAGFSLYTESSAALVGNFGAGAAAEGADASIGWYNPAGLVLLKEQQVVFGGVGVFPSSKLRGISTFRLQGLPDYVESINNINGGVSAFVPSFHYALPLGENATFGLSVVSPFGLSTNWGVASPVRYEGTFTELLTANVSPEFGAKFTENFSVGAGLDFQYARVKFNRVLGLPNIYSPDPGAEAVDSLSYNKGTSNGVGFHGGIMALSTDKHTRVGLNYQSKMRHVFHGYSQLTGRLASPGLMIGDPVSFAASNPNAVFRSNNLSSEPIELPDVVTLSAYHDLNEAFALLGSVVYTGWDTFKIIQLNNIAAFSTDGAAVRQTLVNNASPQNYKGVWRVALGGNYHVNPQWMLRLGGGYDQSPVNNIDRDVRLPDADRWALSLGAHYQMKPSIGLDFGYTHIFASKNPTLNRTDPLSPGVDYNVNAIGSSNANLIGAQLVWVIDQKTPQAPMK